ncbi:MAG: hypothetical protein IT372_39800 [Polyangiaceae bacterium]|nr:hypothetical protein [Polyangiaceae bacterium]
MLRRARSFWIAAAAVAYAAFAALRASGGSGPAWAALIGAPALLALGWRLTARPARGEDRIEPAARDAARACVAGAAMLAAARSGPATPALVAVGNLGAATASMAALVALARVGGMEGLLETPPSTRRLDAAAFASLFWTVAIALPAVWAVAPERAAGLDPIAIAIVTSAASLGSLTVTLVALGRARIARRLELGVADRTDAALLLSAAALAIGLLAVPVGVARPEEILPVTSAAAALCVAWSVVAADPATVSRALRTALSLAAMAAPVALLAVYAVHVIPAPGAAAGRGLLGLPASAAGAAVFAACAACAAAGVAAPRIARRLAPEGARWIAAFDAATRAAMNPEPEAALEAALMELGLAAEGTGRRARGAASGYAPAALYRLSPPERIWVDRAGYAHTEAADLPARLIELGDAEPEGVLRTEVAEAAEVRRPEVRPLLAWLAERDVGALAIVRDATGPIGALAIPRGRRAAPMLLEEVRGLRALADRLGAVIGVSAMLSRSRQRELAARREVAALEDQAQALRRSLSLGEGRLRALAEIFARPARAAAYSPAARAAVEQLERLGASGGPVTLLSAPGIDAVAWAALAHLASPRAGGALTIVDGASAAEHALARWRDPAASPIEAARGGTLVVLDAQALPAEVQGYLGAALAAPAASERDAARGAGGVGLVVSVPQTVDALVALGQMSERLADLLGDRAVALPALASRGEDLRALSLEHLARIGTRLRGQPFGLDLRALSAILEYDWPGNDAELGAVLLRAALAAEGDVIGARELAAIGFPPEGAPRGARPGAPDHDPERARGPGRRARDGRERDPELQVPGPAQGRRTRARAARG